MWPICREMSGQQTEANLKRDKKKIYSWVRVWQWEGIRPSSLQPSDSSKSLRLWGELCAAHQPHVPRPESEAVSCVLVCSIQTTSLCLRELCPTSSNVMLYEYEQICLHGAEGERPNVVEGTLERWICNVLYRTQTATDATGAFWMGFEQRGGFTRPQAKLKRPTIFRSFSSSLSRRQILIIWRTHTHTHTHTHTRTHTHTHTHPPKRTASQAAWRINEHYYTTLAMKEERQRPRRLRWSGEAVWRA